MFGSHLSIAGGMHKALLAAEGYEMQTVQVFTKNQQQWRVPPFGEEAVDAMGGASRAAEVQADRQPRQLSDQSGFAGYRCCARRASTYSSRRFGDARLWGFRIW